MPDAPRKRVVVVGAGIAGLATAWRLQQQGVDPLVLDAADRAGGKVRTGELDGVPLDVGPDTFLGRMPWAVDLCHELGLGDDLIAPATSQAWLWSGDAREQPRRLPEGLALGVPLKPVALARSGVISPEGLARAALDVVLPPIRPRADPSVADVVGDRLGREVLERLVDPLIGGINAGRSDRLSMAAVAPDLFAAHRRHRSLILGLRAERRKTPPSDAPLFLGLRGGMERLTSTLAAKLDVRLASGVEAVTRAPSGGLTVAVHGDAAIEADAVVLAVPARAATKILGDASPRAAAALAQTRFASVAVATLAYDPEVVSFPQEGSGFLVPRVSGRLVTACTWFSSKWPHVRPRGLTLLRCSAGRDGDERISQLDDDELVQQLHDDIAPAMLIHQKPVESVVTRWPNAFPQYDVGHLGRVDAAERALARELPGVTLVGASYRGVGIASCVRQATEAARRISG